MATKHAPQRDMSKEGLGWISMIIIMFMFPALFYLCVFFPIWVGWTPRWSFSFLIQRVTTNEY